MKIRQGFVSNSSSSSFIVIGKGDWELPTTRNLTEIIIPDTFGGNNEFGWETAVYDDFGSKLNWAALIALYEEDKPYEDMLIEVLKDDFKVDNVEIRIEVDYNAPSDPPTGKTWGYIDHQSMPAENPDNASMFFSKAALRDFLYCRDSEIHGDNDNH